ncbi:MAG: argininosuccinate lyase [Thermoproteota archaeon]|nr:argininosuccinate lyase [Thermoproteota archaeon]
MYRSRPHGNLDESALSFLSSVDDDYNLLYYDILGSQAHVIMLFEVGILSKNELKKILKSTDSLLKDASLLNQFGNSNSEDIHELVESAIIKMTDIDSGGKMHTARSRNDQVVLDIRMKVRDDVNTICQNLLILITSLVKRAEENVDSIMPMYTHLQHAQLGVFSHYLLSYAYTLTRDFDRFFDLYDRINCSPLGACAIGGSSIDIDRDRVSCMLGFSSLIYNSIDATSSRDSLIEFASNSLICMLNLCKIAEDFIIWSTSEFGFISLDDKFSSSSSVMPQKKNPDPLEIIRGKTGAASGLSQSISSIIKGLPSGYSRDLQEIKPSLWKISLMLKDSLMISDGIIKTFNVDKKRMYKISSESYAISLDIAEQLIKRKKISFRYSHKLVGGLVDCAVKKGNIPLNLLNIGDISQVLANTDFLKYGITPDEIYTLIKDITPENSINYRITKGSPNKKEQLAMILLLNQKLDEYQKKINLRIDSLRNKINDLKLTVDKNTNDLS